MYRIKATLSPASRLVTFNEVFEGTKNGFLSLVNNITPEMHGRFSFGTIYGGEMRKHPDRALSFMKGGFWNFSTLDRDLMFEVYKGIASNNEFAFGMYIDAVDDIKYNFVDGINFISSHPGIVLRKFMQEGGVKHMTMLENDDEFLNELQAHTREKVRAVAPNLNWQGIYINAVDGGVYKRKSALVDGSYHIFNEGILAVDADKNVMEIISHIGIGDLGYLGFGHVTQTYDPRGKRDEDRILRPNEIMRTSNGYKRGERIQDNF